MKYAELYEDKTATLNDEKLDQIMSYADATRTWYADADTKMPLTDEQVYFMGANHAFDDVLSILHEDTKEWEEREGNNAGAKILMVTGVAVVSILAYPQIKKAYKKIQAKREARRA